MCFSNELIDSAANRDFVNHAVNWLVDQPYLLSGVSPRAVKEYRLNLTNTQMTSLYLVMLAGMPGGVLLLGTLVWFRRRK
jgi:hypothetical protein